MSTAVVEAAVNVNVGIVAPLGVVTLWAFAQVVPALL
jgi:hypothetical protein